ncbi:MAG: hydantoinase/oxoprolinase family protein [Proteobacteria bacterium]|nr:hydantoinase/oxoprolinase family protein [Pseudomonadota bacterium]
MGSRFALAVDIGGTFTDFVLLDRDTRTVLTDKVLTTPQAPEQAILQGVDKLSSRFDLQLASTDLFLHATTIITNAVIERRGAPFALLYTAGFKDVLEIGRENRYSLTDLKLRFPEPVSERHLRFGIDERMSAAGDVVVALDKAAVQAQVAEIIEQHGIRNFAICFVHSYKNPSHEEAVRDWILELRPDAYVSCSSAIAPSQREYERWTTCTINAYAMPLLVDYVARLAKALAHVGFAGHSLMMTSSGLPLEFERCVRYPIRMIESGPAAGVLAAQEVAKRNSSVTDRLSNVLAYDMGGTTAKGAFVTNGAFRVQRALEVARIGAFQPGSGLPLMIPAIDLIEIGAGGGSIAGIDDRGSLAVGPASAGADPGPACYGRGGLQPTVTDANIALGYLSEENFANSGILAKRDLALAALSRLAERLGAPAERVSRGIRDTVNENVARAFRVHAGELGLDYRRYAMVCTGGSAPLHAAEIARILNISTVVFPFGAGVSSAFGLFVGREGLTLQRTNTVVLQTLTADAIRAEVDKLIVSDANARSLASEGASVSLSLGMRYLGQGYEIEVQVNDLKSCDVHAIREEFLREYRRVFGVTFPDYVVEVFNWTVQLTKPDQLCDLSGFRYQNAGASGKKKKTSRAIGLSAAAAPVSVWDRYALRPGDVIEGGALIEENDTTIYLPAFARGVVAESFDIIADIRVRH